MVSKYKLLVCLSVILVFQLNIQDSHQSCTDQIPDIDTRNVAVMCSESVVSGTNVYIDASLATKTFLDNGIVCTCSVQAEVGKIMEVATLYSGVQNSDCGGVVNFNSQSPGVQLPTNVSCLSRNMSVATNTMEVDFLKVQTPYDSSYCVGIDLVYCNDTEFQCNDGNCIASSSRCDVFPDCSDHSDEDNCGVTCTEGQKPCNDGQMCIQPELFCDGQVDCNDGSDELNCGNSTVILTTMSPVRPLITITCTESILKTTTTLTEVTTSSTTTEITSLTLSTSETTSSSKATVESSTPMVSKNTTKNNDIDDDSSNKDKNIVIVIVVVIVVLFIAGVLAVLYKKRKRSQASG
ncbi:hypothetical protein ACF0H5_008427 [Mactra antiquata]